MRGEKVCALNGARCKGIEYRGRGVQSDIGGACETDFAPPTPCLSSKTVTSSSLSQFFVDVTTLPFRWVTFHEFFFFRACIRISTISSYFFFPLRLIDIYFFLFKCKSFIFTKRNEIRHWEIVKEMNSRIWRVGGIAFCLLRSGEHYDNVQCRVGIHCTLSNRLRSLPGLLSRSRGVRNKQAQVENSSSLSVLSVPLFSLFSFIRPPSCTIQISCRFCSWLEKRKIRYLFATEILLAPISLCVYTLYLWYMLNLRPKIANKNSVTWLC